MIKDEELRNSADYIEGQKEAALGSVDADILINVITAG